MVYNQEIGKRGEDAVCAYIEREGMRVRCRNFYCRGGEIDIIAGDAECVVFIEVKTRTGKKFGSAAEAVTPAKMRKLALAAQEYIAREDLHDCALRFDVAEVYIISGREEINYIRNAF